MIVRRVSRPQVRQFRFIELCGTMLRCPTGWSWTGTSPLAGDLVVTNDGYLGYAMHQVSGRPLLPNGGQHRYVIFEDDSREPLAYHISQLRPFEYATEIC